MKKEVAYIEVVPSKYCYGDEDYHIHGNYHIPKPKKEHRPRHHHASRAVYIRYKGKTREVKKGWKWLFYGISFLQEYHDEAI